MSRKTFEANFQFVMMSMLLLFNLSSLHAQPAEVARTHLIRIQVDQKEYAALEQMKINFATGCLDTVALAVVTPAELGLLEERGYRYEQLMRSDQEVELYKRALYGESRQLDPIYHTCDEILEEIRSLVRKYPKLIWSRKIGQTTQEKRDIFAVKISKNVQIEEDEPAILFSGAIHSDEIAGTEICMTLMNQLVTGYGVDSRITQWLDQNEIWIIPVINVDGHHVVTQNIDPRWRKNCRDNNHNGILYEKADGIDLNRNFNFNWAHGGSPDSTSSRYRGEYPFSELECVAVRDLALEQKFVLSLTYHSQGEVIFYPWVWRDRKAPDDKLLTQMANALAGSIRTLKGDTTYQAHYGAGTVGQTYPWLYGVVGTLDFIVETGKNWHIFPISDLKKIIQANLPGAFYLLDQLDGPGLTGRITDAKTGKPLQAEVWLPDIDTEDIERRTSDVQFGRFYRRLQSGKYRVIVMKNGYPPEIVKQVEVQATGWTQLNIKLNK